MVSETRVAERQEKKRRRQATQRQRKKHQETINAIRTKLFMLGFVDQPLGELKKIASQSSSAFARSLAALQLALWHMRAKTDDDYRTALDWISRARPDARDQDFLAKLSGVEMLCHYHLNDHASGLAAYVRATRAGEAAPDLWLARVNFEPTPELRVAWINQVLVRYGIEPVTLLPDEGQPAYDRLTCAVDLPKITNGPKVTVLVAAYDAADMLPTALRSLQEQTWANQEIIVLDDSSPTMDTVRVAEGFAMTDPRIKVVRMPKNSGPYVARNHGLDIATGEFVTLHDADDWSHPRKIETQVRFMMNNPELMGCVTRQARANNDLKFVRMTQGAILVTNISSFMFKRAPIKKNLGYWDTVRFSADNELIRRVRTVFGKNSVCNLRDGPLSFQREGSSSAIADPALGVFGLLFGARRQYLELQNLHHKSDHSLLNYKGNDARPFPAPCILITGTPKKIRSHYDIILASDFRFRGGTSASNAEEIIAQSRLGFKTGLVEILRYNGNPGQTFNQNVVNAMRHENVDIISYGDIVSCDLLVIRQPMALQQMQRFLPTVHASKIKLIINQTPRLCYPKGREEFNIKRCAEIMERLFGALGEWHPIGPLVRTALVEHHANELQGINLSQHDWHNIIDIRSWSRGERNIKSGSKLRIGRHSRDAAVKWPDSAEDILAAYPDCDDVEVHVLGGAKTPGGILGHIPANWTVHEFGSLHPRDFLWDIDVWVYFANPGWVESFGRTIIEAMAVGVPVILPEMYRPLFQDSVLYATPQTALEMAQRLHADPVVYGRHVVKAKAYARDNFSYEMHAERLQAFVRGSGHEKS